MLFRSSPNITNCNIYSRLLYTKIIKALFKKEFLLFRKYKLRLNLNKYKFQENLLYFLSSQIGKYYHKKVEFNIVNMKSIVLNTDLFTKILTLKLKKKKAHVMKMINIILNKAVFPRVNRIQETGRIIKSVDFNQLENKYKNFNLNSILGVAPLVSPPTLYPSGVVEPTCLGNEGNGMEGIEISDLKNLDNLLRAINSAPSSSSSSLGPIVYEGGAEIKSAESYTNLEFKNYNKIYDIIFNNIRYKNMGGIRLRVKGRLTKRYRADRAVMKIRWKGGLENIDSAYKGLSAPVYRGFLNPNVECSLFTSKRKIGAFAVKGWLAGKSYSTITNNNNNNTVPFNYKY